MLTRSDVRSAEREFPESNSSGPSIAAKAWTLGSHSRAYWPWILGAVCGLFYLWTFSPRSEGIIVGNDVVNYADELVGGAETQLLSTVNHLGYRWLCFLCYRALALWPGAVDGIGLALRAQQVVSALGGALTIAAIARLSNRQGGWRIALPLSCALALTQGLWFSCAVGDSYAPAMGASAGLLCSALGPVLGRDRPRWFTLFLWLFASVLIRQDAVLILPALALLVPWRTLIPVVAGAAVCAFGVYAWAWTNSGDPRSFWAWLLGIASTDAWGRGWSVDGLRLAYRFLLYIFQPADFYRPGLGWLTLAPVGLAAVLARPPSASVVRGAIACAIYAVSCFAFYTWWQAENVEYQIPMLLPILAALALLIRPRG